MSLIGKDEESEGFARAIYCRRPAEGFPLVGNGGYPLMYKRSDEKGSFIIALNHSKECKKVCVNGELVFSKNCFYDGREMTLHGKSFAIFQEKP